MTEHLSAEEIPLMLHQLLRADYAEAVIQHIADLTARAEKAERDLAQSREWRPIESAPRDEAVKLELGILRNGKLDEIHIGGWREGDADHDEPPSWWSDQADDEINPQLWRPFTTPTTGSAP